MCRQGETGGGIVLLEKLLRVQPNLKKLYVLVREKDGISATDRFRHEVIHTDLFDVLREKWGKGFDSLISQKVVAVAGDASCDNLGVRNQFLREEMWKEIDIVFHVAAATKFFERYDVAFNTNTMGVMHAIEFAKKCEKIQVLLHVSTAYVSGEKAGLIPEKPFTMGEALKGTSKVDIDAEKRLINKTLEDLKSRQVSEDSIKKTMRELGNQRAKQYGWPHVYVFTKSMGEMIIGQLKGNLPVVILRPTIVTSTYEEPIPGWVEGLRMMDPVLLSYGKGLFNYFFCKGSSFIDLIPADMVVNSMLVAAVAHANPHPCLAIYQLGSSFTNPLTFKELADFFFCYFSEKPLSNNEGNPIKVCRLILIGNLLVFLLISRLFFLVIKVLRLVDMVSMHHIQGFVDRLDKKLTTIVKLVGVYKPHLCYDGIFQDDGIEALGTAARRSGVDETTFCFDPRIINWEDYFLRVHIPGATKRLSSSKSGAAVPSHTCANAPETV